MKTAISHIVFLTAFSISPLTLIADELSMTNADRQLYAQDENPGELYIMKGEVLFNTVFKDKATFAKTLGVRVERLPQEIASYPKYIPEAKKVIALDQAIQRSMTAQKETPFALSSPEMLYLSSYIYTLANGQAVHIDIHNKKNAAAYAYGKQIFQTRRGERGLSCYSCHAPNTIGLRLRMQILPNLGSAEAKSGATWPAYRMTKSELTSLQKRFQGCMQNSLQKPLLLGSDEMVALEVYVRSLANTQTIAIPGLKR